MTTFRTILAATLSILLMFSLIIWGVFFMIKSTLLNPDFITERVEQTDITQLANDFSDEYFIEEIPEDMRFFEDVVYGVIADHEPWLKEQFSIAVHKSYDYLQKKTDSLDIRIPLGDLKESARDSLWLHFMEKLPEWISSPDDEGLKNLIYENIYDFAEGIPTGYLPPVYSNLPEEELKAYVDIYFDDIEEQITDGQLPPALQDEFEDLLLPYFNQYYDEIVEDVPSEIIINERNIIISEDNIVNLDIEVLETIRKWVGVFNAVYYALIALMVLLVAGIVLAHFNVKGATRSLSKTFLLFGVTEFVAVMIARYLVPRFLPTGDLPESFQTLITDTYTSVLNPLLWLSVGIMIAGAALLVFSIFYHRDQAAKAED